MIPVTTAHGRRIALFGLGGSGLATARALQAGGAVLAAFDDNPDRVEQARAEGVGVVDPRSGGIGLTGCSALVLSPGVPLTHPRPHWCVELAVAAGVPVIGDIELFARERRQHAPKAPFIAITGTNGKSTTTALIAHVLRQAGKDVQMGGNIGRAVLSLEPPEVSRHYVVECSSYQIDLAPSLDPTIGILLNVTPDHLDRHGSMENYAGIKERLVAASGTAVVGVDDDYCRAIADRIESSGRPIVRISSAGPQAGGIGFDGRNLVLGEGGGSRVLTDLSVAPSLRGRHNAQNAAAAWAACRAAGLDETAISSGFASFPGLAHRMQRIARLGRVVFVNDSKATNADAAEKALASYDRIHWIAGGLAKEGGIAPLAAYFPKIAKAYLIGEAGPQFAVTLGAAAPFVISQTIDAAVRHAAADAAAEAAQAGDGEAVVLLSPACASFDQFQNFEKRGDAFRDCVLALPGIEPIGDDPA